jgi:hypothetical protein
VPFIQPVVLPFIERLEWENPTAKTGIKEKGAASPRVLLVERGFDYGIDVRIVDFDGTTKTTHTAPLAWFFKPLIAPAYDVYTSTLAYGVPQISLASSVLSSFPNSQGVFQDVLLGIPELPETGIPAFSGAVAFLQQMLQSGETIKAHIAWPPAQLLAFDFSAAVFLELPELSGYYAVQEIREVNNEDYSFETILQRI